MVRNFRGAVLKKQPKDNLVHWSAAVPAAYA